MKTTLPVLFAILGVTSIGLGQSPSPAASPAAPATAASPSARTDIYHVHLAKAAVGKANELGEVLKKQAPDAPMKGHLIVLRHQHGDAWDYCVIEHLGTKVTIDASRPAPPANEAALSEWHTDTICAGPPWAEFAKQLGLEDAAKTTASAYIVSIYRPVPGQRDALDKLLGEPPDRTTDSSSGNIVLQHSEGDAWTFMGVTRYNGWADLAKDDVNSIPKTGKPDSAWSKIRNVVAFHSDTLCDRMAP